MRHENLLKAENCLLLVVDIQEAFQPHIAEIDRVTKHYSEAIDRLKTLMRRKDRFA